MELAGTRRRAVRIGGGLVFAGVLVATLTITLAGALLGAAVIATQGNP